MGLQAETAISLKIDEYWKNGGAENIAVFFALLYNARTPRTRLPVPAPIALRTVGVYHPNASELAPTLDAYLAWYLAHRRPALPANAPVIGITFFHTSYKTGDLAHINALIAEIEKHGLIPAAMCGWPPAQELPKILDPKRHPLRALLVMNYNFARPEDATLLENIDVPAISLMTTRQSFAVWKDSPHGIPPEGLAQQVSAPERAGVAEPIVIATTEQAPGSTERYFQPIPDRIAAAVARARRWLTLQSKPNADKRLAMLYYNNPAGKGGIGASYLNVPGTIRALLDRLRDEGYQTGGEAAPDEKTLIGMLEQSGRNVEVWAPGELDRMVSARHTVLISMEKYRRWFATLPAAFQTSILQHWGPPEKTRLMVIRDRDNRPYFVVPGLRFGNVFLGPQPLKSSFEEAAKSQHNTAIPPPHAYIAAYLWYRHEFLADAVIHLGRHGTLEFLPGKNVGQAGTDASEVILGDLPNAYYYILDGGGESTIARRRSAAVLIGHLTPMVVPAGQQAGFDRLRQLLKDYEESASEPLKAEYEKGLRAEISKLKLDSQLSVNLANWPDALAQVKAFLEETESGAIPLGIHTVGTPPRDQLQREAVAQYVRDTFKDPNSPEAKAAADNWLARLRQSPTRELDALPRILSGHFQPSGMSGDPLRTPEALPSGRNLHDFDPTRIPTKEACTVAKRLADGMVTSYKATHGAYPEKIAMVLWYGETARHQGVLECQALALLGVEPVWNNRGVPDSLRLVPLAELRRPRVDVVYTLGGIYRDGFPDKVLLLDKATQLVANTAENGDNIVARNTARIAAALRKAGVDDATAARAARARAFAAAPGDYGAAIAKIAKQSRDQDGELVSTYLNHMGHAYSSELWGQSVPNALSSHLQGNQVVLNSRSSAVYGVLDNDDFFEFTGGLNAATKAANGGNAPEFLVVDVRKRGNEKVTPMKKYLATELNARFWNPKWIQEMQRGGYSGARELADNLENLYGWQATSQEIMDGAFWQNSFDVYVKDKHNLGLKDFFQKESPHARQAMLARLLEVDRQGSHKFSPEDRARLVREFVSSVSQSGTACSANVCGNRRLRAYAMEQAQTLNDSDLSEADRRRFEQQYRDTTQAPHAQPQPKPHLTTAKPKPQPRNKLASIFDKVRLLTPEEWARVARVRPFGIPPFWLFAPLPLGALYGWYRRRTQGRTEAAMLRLSLIRQ
ncbi:MAG: cobaltochelatase subunit CobN [Bryobacterales bacterium]|nr:cobaltochelatase subunit CobN [Bryobacterales bacterium]